MKTRFAAKPIATNNSLVRQPQPRELDRERERDGVLATCEFD